MLLAPRPQPTGNTISTNGKGSTSGMDSTGTHNNHDNRSNSQDNTGNEPSVLNTPGAPIAPPDADLLQDMDRELEEFLAGSDGDSEDNNDSESDDANDNSAAEAITNGEVSSDDEDSSASEDRHNSGETERPHKRAKHVRNSKYGASDGEGESDNADAGEDEGVPDDDVGDESDGTQGAEDAAELVISFLPYGHWFVCCVGCMRGWEQTRTGTCKNLFARRRIFWREN